MLNAAFTREQSPGSPAIQGYTFPSPHNRPTVSHSASMGRRILLPRSSFPTLLSLSSSHKQYATAWFGSRSDRAVLARSVSPLTYARKNTPPTFTVHGDADQLVPYSHAVRLHDALKKAGVTNELVTIFGGRHGGFSKDDMIRIHDRIRRFLRELNIVSPGSSHAE